MKKFNYLLLGLAGLTLASCSQEDVVAPGSGDGNVAITINLPGDLGTRADFGDGTSSKVLKYAVYTVNGETPTLSFEGTGDFGTSTSTTLNLNLLNKQYKIAFFAQSEASNIVGSEVYTFEADANDATIGVNYANMTGANNNADAYDCFYNFIDVDLKNNTTTSFNVDLYRPVAQVNWGTNEIGATKELSDTYGDTGQYINTQLKTSTPLPTSLTVFGGVTGTEDEYTGSIGVFARPTDSTYPVDPTTYKYVAIQYILVGAPSAISSTATSATYDFSLDISNDYNNTPADGVYTNTVAVANAPIQANYQTNIYGSLLSNNASFNIEVIPGFAGQYNLPQAWDGTTITFPKASADGNTYTVTQGSDLAGLAAMVNGTNGQTATDFAGKTIELSSDVDLGGHSLMIGSAARSGSAANADASKGFAGTFNGNGNTISNLTLTGTSNANDATAFIPWLNGENASVKDVIFENFTIKAPANEQVGVVGLLTDGASVSGVTIMSGNIEAFEGAGIVGRMMKSGSISDCENHANITVGQKNGAGIAGAAYYTEEGSVMTISNCKNYGNIKTTGTSTGATTVAGIVGTSAAQVTECVNYGQITGGSASNSYGGIVGAQFSAGFIEGCTNYGNVSGCNYVGGIVGKLDYSDDKTAYQRVEVLNVENNTNYGNVLGTNEFIGGIVGYSRNSSIVSGNANYAKSITGKSYLAGLVGNAATNISPYVGKGYCTLTNNKTSTTLDQMSPNATPKNEFYNLNNSTQSKIDESGNTLVEAPAE